MQHQPSFRPMLPRGVRFSTLAVLLLSLPLLASVAAAQNTVSGGMQAYTQAHAVIQDPPDRLGGPVEVTLTQPAGGAGF